MENFELLTEQQLRDKYGYNEKKTKSLSERLKNLVTCNSDKIKSLVFGMLPVITLLSSYRIKKYLPGDIISGLTIAIVRIPQSLAYGMLAGLNPINGMYTAFLAPLVYTVFGTSKHISVGTFAIVSLMTGAALDKALTIANPCPDLYPQTTTSAMLLNYTESTTVDHISEINSQSLAIVCSLTILIGVILIILGVLQLGFISVFLSDPLVSGFTTAAAIYVVTAQLDSCVGIQLSRRSGPLALIKTYIELFSKLGQIQWSEVVISLICFAILIPVKQINRTYKKKLKNIPIPVELLIVILGTVISANVNLNDKYSVSIVGPIPNGLPSPYIPPFSLWASLISDAFSIAIVIFATSASLSKMFAKKHGYEVDANQDLFALGLCQLMTGFLQGHACGAALARSSVQESSGGNTQIAGIFSSIVILIVLLVLGPLLQSLPEACLSCIIIVNLHGLLMQFQRIVQLWRLNYYDLSVWLVTFFAVIFLGVDLGLGVGVIWSLAVVVVRTNKPVLLTLGRLPGTNIFKDISLYVQAEEIPGIKIMLLPQSPTYVNKLQLQNLSSSEVLNNSNDSVHVKVVHDLSNHGDEMLTLADRQEITHLIIDCSYWGYIDTVALSALEQACIELQIKDITVLFASLLPDVMASIEKSKTMKKFLYPDENSCRVYPRLDQAVAACNKITKDVVINEENHRYAS